MFNIFNYSRGKAHTNNDSMEQVVQSTIPTVALVFAWLCKTKATQSLAFGLVGQTMEQWVEVGL